MSMPSRPAPHRNRLRRSATALAGSLLILALAAPAYGGVSPTVRVDGTRLQADLARAADFGWSVAVDGDTLVVGAPRDDAPEANSGSATVYTETGGQWVAQATLVAADHHTGDQLGSSVDIDGDTALVGAPGDNSGGVEATGAAYVFVRSGGTWTQQAKLVPRQAEAFGQAGAEVAISGNLAVFTAPGAGIGRGAVFVFVRSGRVWTQQAVLRPDDPDVVDFGTSVAVDAGTIVVGQYGPTSFPPGPPPGSAYVFGRSATGWTQQARLQASDGTGRDGFGLAVAISRDTVVVGAAYDSAGHPGQGSAYVFQRAGIAWTEQAKLLAGDAAAGDGFGDSVAIDGGTVVIGAAEHVAPPPAVADGAAYLFTTRAGRWVQRAILAPQAGSGSTLYGFSVAVSGSVVVVGAPRDRSGSAYVYSF